MRRLVLTPASGSTLVARILVAGTSVALLTACEEDMGQDDWITVDNRTKGEVYIDYAPDIGERPDDEPYGSVGEGQGKVSIDACGIRALVARMGAPDGPVIATRSSQDARDCTAVWVIESPRS